MDTETREIKYQGVRLVIGAATYRQGVKRHTLAASQDALQKEAEPGNQDAFADMYGRVILWPALIAAVVKQEGFEHWPITPDELFDLPEALIDQWYEATYALNPQWKPKEPEAPNGPKAISG